MKKTIYLHIGPGKSGTSAIQSFLAKNNENLKEHGYLYPELDNIEASKNGIVTGGNGATLAKSLLDEKHPFALKDKNTKANILNKFEKILRENTHYNLIISSELFSMLNIESVSKLNEILIKYPFDVKFIFYLRRHDEIVESDYAQQVKKHGYFKSLDFNISERVIGSYNFISLLENYESVSCKDNLIVRVYEKSQFINNNILHDFLFSINLYDYHKDFVYDNKIVNPSPSRKVLELMRLINALDSTQELNRIILELIFSEESFQKSKGEYYIDYASKQKIIDQCAKMYEKISNKYLSRGFLFEKDLKPYKLKSNLNLQPKNIETFFMELKASNEELLQNLYNKILRVDNDSKEFIEAINLIMPALIKVLNKNQVFNPYKQKKDCRLSSLMRNITQYKNFDSADILREVAFAFEKLVDVQTAYKVMEQAHILRPKGPVIKQKLEEYKSILNKEILKEGSEGIKQVGHRDYVGGKFEEIGKLQFDYLVSQGLKPQDLLLDIACGSLRAGVHFINYLNSGNYMGLDKEQELVNLGIEHELGKDKQAEKNPEFIISDKFEFSKFSKIPDYSIAQSLFTHLVEEDIKLCLKNLKAFIEDKPHMFYATFFEVDVPTDGELDYSHSHASFFYTRVQIEQFGKESGWKFKYIGDWNHPRDQKMILFYV